MVKTTVGVGLCLETLPKTKENKYAFLAVNESSVKMASAHEFA